MKSNEDFILAAPDRAVQIYLDPKGTDYNGLRRVAESFGADIELVSGITPVILTRKEQLSGTVVIAGPIGGNELIDRLIAEGILDVTSIQGKRECYRLQLVEAPLPGVDRALVIAGSDKRGTIYGIYSISELIGVSPWVYFADVVPEQNTTLSIPASRLNRSSREPSVKYRGSS